MNKVIKLNPYNMIIRYTILFQPLDEYIEKQKRLATPTNAGHNFNQAIAAAGYQFVKVFLSFKLHAV